MKDEEKITFLESRIQRLENTVQYRDSIIPRVLPSGIEGKINEEHLLYITGKPRLYRKGDFGWHFIDLYKNNLEYDKSQDIGHRHTYEFVKIATDTGSHAVRILGYADAYENYYVRGKSFKAIRMWAIVHTDSSTTIPTLNVALDIYKIWNAPECVKAILTSPTAYGLLYLDATHDGSAWTFLINGIAGLTITAANNVEIRISVEVEDI